MQARIINVKGQEIEISQDNNCGYSGEVWDAALVLSYFMINDKSKLLVDFKDKVVIELGAGTGICGLISASLGAKKVYLTEKEGNLTMLEINLNNNKDKFKDTEVIILPLNWEKKDDYMQIKDQIDIVLCSDLIYKLELFLPLNETIDYFSNKNTLVLMSHSYRKPSDMDFFKLFDQNKWQLNRLPESMLDEEYKAEDIFIITMKKV